MNKDEILEKVQAIVSDQLGLGKTQVKPEANFSSELGADSLDVVELVMALEEAFNIEIPDESAAEISTVQDAVDFISNSVTD
jgi:acyl carrier protein